ncbi:hypothetical protein BCR37DRAFT_375816 [Protomyces lactucae-debilis]|uniref:Uncharacterized protein n=1 Tax=Protomyces lactucae-debilis TaxID=2754530 RepID=A0A1Y2FV24_PROLT|nr:uncharacterized protein BCR37DRAFT_375816 [Protomyces lactucae-debilis]ORY87863.1 hypothetical protein BCR37DRAFT_375816 [Protomyces lactucae-debilis]
MTSIHEARSRSVSRRMKRPRLTTMQSRHLAIIKVSQTKLSCGAKSLSKQGHILQAIVPVCRPLEPIGLLERTEPDKKRAAGKLLKRKRRLREQKHSLWIAEGYRLQYK